MPHYVRLPRNEKGRDFTVGDIHGAYDMVEEALAAVDFNPEADRLISVGDLIDRGSRSADCLKFLAQPWFHAVRGNHEDMFLKYCDKDGRLSSRAESNISNGTGWVFDEHPETLKAIREALLKLPLVIETETVRGSVGFVHADIPERMNWKDFVAAIVDSDENVIQTALWGRSRISYGVDSGVPGIDRVFFGHTPQADGARRLGNCYYIDTGAVFRMLRGERDQSYRLTMADTAAAADLFERGRKSSSGIDIKQTAPLSPFEDYTP